jgi:hypothetical protein
MIADRLPRYHSRREQSLDGLFGIRLHWNDWLHKHRVAVAAVALAATGVGIAGLVGGAAGVGELGSTVGSGAEAVAGGAGKAVGALLPAGTQLMLGKMKMDMEAKNLKGAAGNLQPGMLQGGGGGAGFGGSKFSIPGLSGLNALSLLKNPLVLAGGAALALYLLWPKHSVSVSTPRGEP